jgi:hypothetical protein
MGGPYHHRPNLSAGMAQGQDSPSIRQQLTLTEGIDRSDLRQ